MLFSFVIVLFHVCPVINCYKMDDGWYIYPFLKGGWSHVYQPCYDWMINFVKGFLRYTFSTCTCTLCSINHPGWNQWLSKSPLFSIGRVSCIQVFFSSRHDVLLCEKISCDKSWEIQNTCSMNCCWLLIKKFLSLNEHIRIRYKTMYDLDTLSYCDRILQMLDLCRLYNVYWYLSDSSSCA